MSAHRIASILLEGPDDLDPKDYIDRTLPDSEPPYFVVKRDENAWFNRGVMVGGSEPVVVAVYRDKQKAINYAHNLGGKVYRCTGKSKSVRAWFIAGNKLSESADDIDPKDFIQQQFPDLPVRIEQRHDSAWRIFDLNGHWLGDLFYDAQYLSDAPSAVAHKNWHDIHWFITPADVHKKQAAFRTKHEAIKYLLENDDPEDMVDRVVSGDVPIGRSHLDYIDFLGDEGEDHAWRTADFRYARTLWNLGLIRGCPCKPTEWHSAGPYFGLDERDQQVFHAYMTKPIPVRKAKNIHKADMITQNMLASDAWARLQRDLFMQPEETSVYIELDRQRLS